MDPPTRLNCNICGYGTESPDPSEIGVARGNTARFLDTEYRLWRCPQCQSIHSIDPVDYADIYRDYPLENRKLDVFARGTLRNLLGRLRRAGLRRSDTILDYGCGNGLFVRYLRGKGYSNATGFDPFVPEFSRLDADARFDVVVANDVIEHVAYPRTTLKECAELVRPGGMLYVGTADSEGVADMRDLEPHLMRLHQPFHRTIVTQRALIQLGKETGLTLVRSYKRSYMDTWLPFANYRFLDEFNGALGHNMDLAFAPEAAQVVARKPKLLFYAFFGYLLPSAYEPAIILRRPIATGPELPGGRP